MQTAEFAAALSHMADQMNAALSGLGELVGKLTERVDEIGARQDELLQAIADSKPTVNIPPRPRSFAVEIEGSDGETRQMRVVAQDNRH